MTGTYDRGSVVFDQVVPVASLKVGDVITYRPPAGAGPDHLITHRIAAITTDKSGVRVFRTKGEAFLPTALASMTAKYLRELSMRAFNEYWCARVPNLRPTAGYPGDASRFRGEVAALQRELGIADRVMWRGR